MPTVDPAKVDAATPKSAACRRCGCTIRVVPYKISGVIFVRENPDQLRAAVENTGMWDTAKVRRATSYRVRCDDCDAPFPEPPNA